MLEEKRGEVRGWGTFALGPDPYTCCLDLDTYFPFLGICDYHLKVFRPLNLNSLYFCENYYHKSDYVVLLSKSKELRTL